MFSTKPSVPVLRGLETPRDYTPMKGVTYHHRLVDMKIRRDTSNITQQIHAMYASVQCHLEFKSLSTTTAPTNDRYLSVAMAMD